MFMSIYLFISVTISIFYSAYVISKGRTALSKSFSALCFLVSIYLLGYLGEINSTSLNQMEFWNMVQYLSIPFYPVFSLLISLFYTKTVVSFRKKLLWLFLVPITVFIIRLTNPLHHLYYLSMNIKMMYGINYLSLSKGPIYYLYCGYLCIIFISIITIYLINLFNCNAKDKIGYLILILSSIIPFIGLALIVINPYMLNIDYVIILLPASLFLLNIALFKFDFLELKTLARQALFDKSPYAMLLLDNEDILIDFNSAAKIVFPILNRKSSKKSIYTILKNETEFLSIVNNTNMDTLVFSHYETDEYYSVHIVPINILTDLKIGKLVTLTNITVQKNTEKVLKILATTDPLTNVFNRAEFMNLAKLELERSNSTGIYVSLLMLDIDYFKKINDTRGHAAGDSVLIHFTSEMKKHFGKDAIIARLGGEEFAILLPNTNIKTCKSITENFLSHISNNPATYEKNTINYTFSAGISTNNKKHITLENLLKFADKSLYVSKSNGRKRVSLHTFYE